MSGVCKNCGNIFSDEQEYCTACGAPAQADENMVISEPTDQPGVRAVRIPHNLKPMGAWAFVGWLILLWLPVIGVILAIVFACLSNINRNLRSLARARLLLFAGEVILAFVFILVVGPMVLALLNELSAMLTGLM